ncbi:MAG: methyltransferase domain-containing protein [Armatimonadota bacterium]
MITDRKLAILRCPVCRQRLEQAEERYVTCAGCAARFPVIRDIIVFLTGAKLSAFLNEAWGSELLKENTMFFLDFAYASNETPYAELEQIAETGYREGEDNPWLMSGTHPEDLSMPKELRLAIRKGYQSLFDLSHAGQAECILDWPTGYGACLMHLMNHAAPHTLVAALDIDFRKMATIKPYYDAQGFSDRMLFVVADARNMPFADGAFQAVAAFGGAGEVQDQDEGVRETYRVLAANGRFSLSSQLYREDSPSMQIAQRTGLDALLTRGRLDTALQCAGFTGLEYHVTYEGYDTDDGLTDEERCPLPAQGDWFECVTAAGRKPGA